MKPALVALLLAALPSEAIVLRRSQSTAAPMPMAWMRQYLKKPEVCGTGATTALLGFCTGRACRAAGDAAAVGVGGTIVLLGGLAKAGFITIDFPKIEKQVLTMLDMNKDGKLDESDYKFVSQRALTVLEDNGMVASGAFIAGFAYGFGARPVP
eukprot:CAMPEP_0119058380 /NCGR_PEP_ID=MMETSP1178-20130426/2732_1 /TAXON_ID=33656 /ORGANISM="unid sp, Strain CCMP2000" /LENGTH=153 /DNA_ID=CAMNT_0007039313 /DNA_START=44 /DNA_END=505 /DNA_ORIENTATION=-